jgi:hypothetical protein
MLRFLKELLQSPNFVENDSEWGILAFDRVGGVTLLIVELLIQDPGNQIRVFYLLVSYILYTVLDVIIFAHWYRFNRQFE